MIYEIATLERGRLCIMPMPSLARGGDDSIESIAAAGMHRVVSLLEPRESRRLGLQSEGDSVRASGMEFCSFPIADMGLPDSRVEFETMIGEIAGRIENGCHTLVHCRGGIGRSGLVAAAVLMSAGFDADAAVELVSKRRGVEVPETEAQRRWLDRIDVCKVTGAE